MSFAYGIGLLSQQQGQRMQRSWILAPSSRHNGDHICQWDVRSHIKTCINSTARHAGFTTDDHMDATKGGCEDVTDEMTMKRSSLASPTLPSTIQAYGGTWCRRLDTNNFFFRLDSILLLSSFFAPEDERKKEVQPLRRHTDSCISRFRGRRRHRRHFTVVQHSSYWGHSASSFVSSNLGGIYWIHTNMGWRWRGDLQRGQFVSVSVMAQQSCCSIECSLLSSQIWWSRWFEKLLQRTKIMKSPTMESENQQKMNRDDGRLM